MAEPPRRPLKSQITRQAAAALDPTTTAQSDSPSQRRSVSLATASSTASRPLSTTAAILAANAAASLSSSANSPSSMGRKKGKSLSAHLGASHPPRTKAEVALKVEQTWMPSFSQWNGEPNQTEVAEFEKDALFESGESLQDGNANSLASSYSTAHYRTSFGVESLHSLPSVEAVNSTLLNSSLSDNRSSRTGINSGNVDLSNSNTLDGLRDPSYPASSSSSYRSSRKRTTDVSLSDLVANVSNEDAMRVMQLAMKRAEKKETGRSQQKPVRDSIHSTLVVQERSPLVTSTSMTNISSNEKSDLTVRQRSASHREKTFDKAQSPPFLSPRSAELYNNETMGTEERVPGVDRIETPTGMPPPSSAFNSGSSIASRRTSKSSQGSKVSPKESINQEAELSDIPEILGAQLSEFTLQRSARCKAYLEDRYEYIFQAVSKSVPQSQRFNPIRTMRFIKNDTANTREQGLSDSNSSNTPRRRVSVGSSDGNGTGIGTYASADPVNAGLDRSQSGSMHDSAVDSVASAPSLRFRRRKRLCDWDVDNSDFIHEKQYNELQEAERAKKLGNAAVQLRADESTRSLLIEDQQITNETSPTETVLSESPPPSLRGRDKRRKTWSDLGIGIGLGFKKGFRFKKNGTGGISDATISEVHSMRSLQEKQRPNDTADAGGIGVAEGDLDVRMFPIQSEEQPQSPVASKHLSAPAPTVTCSPSVSITPPISSRSGEDENGKQSPDKSNRLRFHTEPLSASSNLNWNPLNNPLSSGSSASSAFPSPFPPTMSHSSSQTNVHVKKHSPPSTPTMIRYQKRHSIALASGSLGRRFRQSQRDAYGDPRAHDGQSHTQSTVSGTYISASEEDGEYELASLSGHGTGTANVPKILLSPSPRRYTIFSTGGKSALPLWPTDSTAHPEPVFKSRLFAQKVRAKLRRDRHTESGPTGTNNTSDIYDSDSSAQSPISIKYKRDRSNPGLGGGFGIFTRSRGTSPKQAGIHSVTRQHVFSETDRPKRRRSFDALPRRIESHSDDPMLTSSDLDLITVKCRRWTIGATSELAGVENLGAPIVRIPAALPAYDKTSLPACVNGMVNNYNQRRDAMVDALTGGIEVERVEADRPVVFRTLVMREGGQLIDLTVSITDSSGSTRKSHQQKLAATTAKFDNCIRDVKMFLEGLNAKVSQSVNESNSRLPSTIAEQSDRGKREPLLRDLWSTVAAQERKTGTTWKNNRRTQTDMEAALVSLKELNRLLDEDYLREAKQIEDRLAHINLERSQSKTREFFYAFISFVLEISVWLYWFINLLGKLRKVPLSAYRYIRAPTLVPMEDAQRNHPWMTNGRDGANLGTMSGSNERDEKRNTTETKPDPSEDRRSKKKDSRG